MQCNVALQTFDLVSPDSMHMWPIFTKPVGNRSLVAASFQLLKWENPLLVTFDIFVLTVRKNINKYIVSVAFAMKRF